MRILRRYSVSRGHAPRRGPAFPLQMQLPSRPSLHTTAFLLFLAFYLLLIIDIRHVAWRDPGSVFFDPKLAFERHYSLAREAQAKSYIKSADESVGYINYTKSGPDPTFCVGIPTLEREGAQYFQRAAGSVLAGLTEEERQDIWLVSFFVNLDPHEHSAYGENWLPQVMDTVLTYEDVPKEMRDKMEVASAIDYRKKGVFDYMVLLRECYATGTPWVMLLEDDVIGADGWLLRTKQAVNELVGRWDFHSSIYLRLFYNERLLGWNSEEWVGYVVRIVLVEMLVAAALLAVPRYAPKAATVLTSRTVGTIIFVCTPMLITAYFVAGRLTVAGPSAGLHRMDKYGCCSQALAFPREQVPDLIAWYESNQMVNRIDRGYVDVLTEIYAKENALARWALTPSVFQHVGSKSSKSSFISRWGRSNTENIWNFSFERFDEVELEVEHFGSRRKRLD